MRVASALVMTSLLYRTLLIASVAVGCTAQSADEGTTDTPVDLAHPPTRPQVSSVGTTRWFVIDSYRLGTANPDGSSSSKAWARYGYDLDGRATSTDDAKAGRVGCRRPTGAPTSFAVDGDRGIDNGFGNGFMSVMKSLKSDVESETNKGVAEGGYTMVLRIDDLSDAVDDAYAPGALYLVGRRDKATFGPEEKWPVAGTTLTPMATFSHGYVSGGSWVSGDLGTELPSVAIPILGRPLVTPLYGGVLSLQLESGEGTMAGAIRASDFAATIRPWLLTYEPCLSLSTLEQIEGTLLQASDTLATLPLASDPSRTCDAMSLGVGFTFRPIAGLEGTTGAPEKPAKSCTPR